MQAAKQAEAQLKTLGETAKSTVAPGMDRVKEASTGAAGAFGRVLAGARGLVNLLPGLGMAALVGMIASAVGWLAKLVTGADAASESVGKLDEKVKAVKDSLEQSRAKDHEFALSLAMMRKQTDDAKTALHDYLSNLEKYYDRVQKLAEKHRELALSEAELISDPEERSKRIAEIKRSFGQFSESVATDEARAKIVAQDTALVNRYTSEQERAKQLDAEIAEKEAARRDTVALAVAQKKAAEEARIEAETLRKKFGSGAFALPEEHQRVLAAEKYAAQLEEQARQSAARARQRNAELSALEEQRKAVQREILSIDPNAVKAARERMLSPHALDRAVKSETAFDQHMSRLQASIDINLYEAEVSAKLRKAMEEQARLLEEQNRAAGNLVSGTEEALRRWREVNRRLEEVERRIRELRAPLPGQ